MNSKFRLKIGLTIACLIWMNTVAADMWRIALIGDTPYSNAERTELPKMLEAIADSPVDLIAHIGDIKHGAARCDDALFEDRYQVFENSQVPFIYVPGDNEWSDCGRLSNGSYDPLERLSRLRSLFWTTPLTLGKTKLPLERQTGQYPEHSRLRLGPVLFVTLNLPGGDNNWGLTSTPRPEFLQRNPVVIAWIKDSFALARREKLAGIVFLFQADPGFADYARGQGHAGFREVLDRLRSETENYTGKVVAVHGDTHVPRFDRPLRHRSGEILTNFVRVETFGYPLMGWTRGVIDTDLPELIRFDMHPWPAARSATGMP